MLPWLLWYQDTGHIIAAYLKVDVNTPYNYYYLPVLQNQYFHSCFHSNFQSQTRKRYVWRNIFQIFCMKAI